jgi:putative addiction module antidote
MNAPANLPVGTKLIKIGNSVGVILPKEKLAKLGVEVGDRLSITENPGGISLSPYDPEFEHQMATAREVMKRRRNALRELAK